MANLAVGYSRTKISLRLVQPLLAEFLHQVVGAIKKSFFLLFTSHYHYHNLTEFEKKLSGWYSNKIQKHTLLFNLHCMQKENRESRITIFLHFVSNILSVSEIWTSLTWLNLVMMVWVKARAHFSYCPSYIKKWSLLQKYSSTWKLKIIILVC